MSFSCSLMWLILLLCTILFFSPAVAQISETNFAHLRDLCTLNNGEACAQLANQLLKLPDRESYFFEAARAYEKACALEIIWACNNIGDQFYYGKFGRSRDLVKAIRYFELGCKKENEYACSRLVDILGDAERK